MASKKANTKAAQVKEEAKAVVATETVAEAAAETAPVVEAPKETVAKKPAAKKAAAKKTAEKKPAEKKTSTKKAAPKTNLFIQYQGAEVSYADLIEKAKADAGVEAPKNINLYVKPEDNMVYYVIDEKVGGFVLA